MGYDTLGNYKSKTLTTESFSNLYKNKKIEVFADVTTGVAGLTGPRGEMGPAGPRSEMGPAGPRSEMGPVGPRREMDPVGPRGVMGPAGPRGVMGPAGPRGEMGPRGMAGEMGPRGMAGPMGHRGMAGQPGKPVAYFPGVWIKDEWRACANGYFARNGVQYGQYDRCKNINCQEQSNFVKVTDGSCNCACRKASTIV